MTPSAVVVVDAHSKPSAAASLIAQIRREVTDKPVRYVVNTHFHWDHMQGDHAYRQTGQRCIGSHDIGQREARMCQRGPMSLDYERERSHSDSVVSI